MGKIYVGQDNLSIELDTGVTLTGALNLKIKYRKPDSTTGEWTGTLEGTTIIKKSFIDGSGGLDQSGIWRFWAWAEMSDGREIPGEPYDRQIYIEGK